MKMKRSIIAVVAVGTVLASCGGGSKSARTFTSIDSVSYAIGMDLALNTGVRGVADSGLNANVLADAFRDAFLGKTQITPDDANAFLNEWFSVREPARLKAEGQAWLDQVKAANPNIQTTASGLMYEIIEAGDPAVRATSDADQVVVKYAGTLRDGTMFDSRDSISFPLNGVIAGWTEGMKLVGKGGSVVLYVPSDLAYGAQARPQIPANSPLKFEITLLDVIPAAVAE